MKRGFCILLLTCFILTGCASQYKKDATFPIKIGLLADSQITSDKGYSDFHFRSKAADSLIDVAIRPPALERYLAKEMLKIALDKLTLNNNLVYKKVDIILYLGDAANSGGEDEIKDVLDILRDYRTETNIPIYIIIGNHDYLAAGNTYSPGAQFALLNRWPRGNNKPLTKYEVLKKFSNFNRENNNISAVKNFTYKDNFDDMEDTDRNHNEGLYLSGIISDPNEAVEILLVDSSDYKDSSPLAPEWFCDLFAGSLGGVSYKNDNSQIDYFIDHKSDSPAFRFIASHYPREDIDRITKFSKPGDSLAILTNSIWGIGEFVWNLIHLSKPLDKKLEKLLIPEKRNYWLSAHSHAKKMPKPNNIAVGGFLFDKYFKQINIGSTTDFMAHVAIVEQCHSSDKQIDGYIGYREIPLFDYDEKLLEETIRQIEGEGRHYSQDKPFKEIIKTIDEEWFKNKPKEKTKSYCIYIGATMLGLNKEYRQFDWKDEQSEASAENLRKFIKNFKAKAKYKNYKRADIISCLGFLAGAYEDNVIPPKCDFSPKYLTKIKIN